MDMGRRGSGTLRNDGRWQFVRTIGGRKRTFIQREGESRTKLVKRVEEAAHSPVGRAHGMRLTEAIGLYLEFRRGEPIAAPTLTDDLYAGRHLSAAVAGIRVEELNGVAVDEVLRRWDGCPRTKKKMRDFGRKLYRHLVRQGWTGKNPFRDSTPVKYRPEDDEEPMRPEDFAKAIAFIGGSMKALLVTLRCTALRPLGVRELTWPEVEIDGEAVYIKLSRAKTPAGRRRIRVQEPAASMIRELPKESILVFPSSRGGAWSAEWLLEKWKEAQAKAGLEPRKVYDLKKMRVTELCEAFDGDAWSVCRVIGLESSQVVERHYRQARQRELDERAAGVK